MTEYDPIDPYRLYTRDEAADFLRVSVKWLDVIAVRGDLYSVRSGRRRLFPRYALTAYIKGEEPEVGGLTSDDDTEFPPTRSIFNERGDQ